MAGTRGGLGRVAAMVIGLAVALVLVLAGAARAGTYEVAQCGWGVGAELDPVQNTGGQGYLVNPALCAPPPGIGAEGLRLEAQRGLDNYPGMARARWVPPPSTVIVAARATWAAVMQSGFFQVLGYDTGPEFRPLAEARGVTAEGPVGGEIPGGGWALEVRMQCGGGPVAVCSRSQPSWLLFSGLTMTILDPLPPAARIGGSLLAPGWRRGTALLDLAAEDLGAGVAREEASLDGAPLGVVRPGCDVLAIEGVLRATRMRPCPPSSSQTIEVDTTRLADGAHTLRYCATDFGGEVGCVPDAQVEVDNSAPAIAFAATEEGLVAATVSDPLSGPRSGSISMRRADSDSWTDLPTAFQAGEAGKATLTADLPALSDGSYVFRASADDAVGNAGAAELKVSGAAAEVREQIAAGGGRGEPEHPSRSGGPRGRGGRGPGGRTTHLNASLTRPGHGARSAGRELGVRYGTATVLRGRLTRADGAGLGERRVTVLVRAARGARVRRAVHRLLTDERGRFRLEVPAGVSRHLFVSFHGADGLAPSRARPVALRVRAAVSLTAEPQQLRTGQTVLLSGRVRPGAARIPRRGKLVTIQYLERASGRWRPALVVRTDSRGRFHDRYRFRYVTGAAHIHLRATALPEAGWPYASGSSRPVTVEVHG